MDWLDKIKPKDIVNKKHSAHTKIVFNIFNKVTENVRVDFKYKPEIRFSKLPLCGLLFVKELCKGNQNIHFSQDFFTNIGTAVHDAFQKHFPLTEDVSKYTFGNWRCSKCEKVTVALSTTPKNLICPKCKFNTPTLEYSEIEVNYKGIKGHIDMILLVDGIYYLIDFKTASQNSIENPSNYLPYPKNVMQIQSYCFALKYEFNIKIKHYTLIYVSRDSTSLEEAFVKKNHSYFCGVEVTDKMLATREKQLEHAVKTKQLVKKFMSEPNLDNIKLLDAARPCHSEEDYTNKTTGMKYAFIRKDCPYLDSCCSQTKLTRAAKDILEMVK